ncbi:hypothetical protein ACWEO2_43285 [Nocardia sp. NPDC004278]
MSNLRNLLSELGRDEEAERWLRVAVGAGSGTAMANLGSLYFRCERVAEYEKWWRRGAAAGDVTSMYNLAVVLEIRDRDEAAEFFRAAAAAGPPYAAEKLQGLLTGWTRSGAPYIAGIF